MKEREFTKDEIEAVKERLLRQQHLRRLDLIALLNTKTQKEEK